MQIDLDVKIPINNIPIVNNNNENHQNNQNQRGGNQYENNNGNNGNKSNNPYGEKFEVPKEPEQVRLFFFKYKKITNLFLLKNLFLLTNFF